MRLDVSDQEVLSQVVEASDVVVRRVALRFRAGRDTDVLNSLLPAPMHPQVAKHCIAHGKHLVTASYVSPEMRALDEQ